MTTLNNRRQLQSEATRHSPAPWVIDPELPGDVRDDSNEPVSWGADPAGPALIAAAPTHLADLITALEQIERIREVHKAETVHAITGYDCCIEDCDHEGECPTEPIEVCAECNRIAKESYRYFGENGLGNVLYPCPTIRILDGNE
ncbi:hypothetical protein DWB68_10300 [Galactobacter valiniphilus]|uniref:Uncharacterized protein n=1 Tax=Galactobacter valiniphilus TaxID=2676122 RepID=A0A399J8Q7_9MICC|nr:hypothetical protein [Galactobacter valiniphilus]RII41908.1 hypothetical protein DWB68_10300 [Galactobacter valiniphilus]